MSGSGQLPHTLGQIERGLGALLLVLVVALHVILLLNGGGLWRDEANTVQLANLATLGEVWKYLQFDSFPILWLLVVRAWTAALGPDLYRVLGFLVGLGIVGALCWNVRRTLVPVPLFALLLLAFNPALIRYGDSVRAYGFGVLLFLVTFGLVWKVATAPTRRNVAAATILALLSVHALYYNAVLLLALCAGGAAVTMRHRQWRRLGLLVAIGGIAAVSLLPYVSTIQAASEWNGGIRIPNFDLAWFWGQLSRTAASSGEMMVWVWVALFFAGTAVGICVQVSPRWLHASDEQADRALFCVTVLLVGTLGYFIFLKILSYPTQPWYYVALLALMAMSLEFLLSLLANRVFGRILRLLVVVPAVLLTFGTTAEQAHLRHTNIDIIARQLEKAVDPQDFILVNYWYYGVSFQNHYRGKAPWTTVPPIADHRFHRYDLVIDQMKRPDPADALKPSIEQIAAALRTGHTVWIVGAVLFLRPEEKALEMPRGEDADQEGPYFNAWSQQVGRFLQEHANRIDRILVPATGPMGPYENVQFLRAQGWKEAGQ